MYRFDKQTLNQLTNEQLIWIIEQFNHSQFLISETCVEESKLHISSEKAVDKIRKYLFDMPRLHNIKEASDIIDVKMGKITVEEFRKKNGYED